MAFGNLNLTDVGANLLSKVAAGGTLQFNRVALGSGTWAGGTFDPEMVALVSEQISLGIQTLLDVGDGKARLTTILLYEDLLATGFDASELGVFAEDPDDGEILFAAAYAATPDAIPANTEVPAYEHVYNLGIAIGNATSLTVEVESSITTATLQDLSDHAAETDVHGATSAPTPDRIIMRDAAGRAQIVAPSAAADIARKDTVDAHAAETAVHGATSGATASRIVARDAAGRAQVAAPSAAADIARKQEVDDEATARAAADAAHAADASGAHFPSGTVMLFGQSSAPVGWTRKADWADNAMLCFAASGAIGSGGSADPQAVHTHAGPSHVHSTQSHTLTIAEIPSHTHTYYQKTGWAYAQSAGSQYGNPVEATSGAAGGGNAHSHGNTGTSGTGNTGANAAPKYQEVIAATKD